MATKQNFVTLSKAVLSGSAVISPPQVVALDPASAAEIAAGGGGTLIDVTSSDLSRAGYAKNGAFTLNLSASTPVTVDLTATGTGTSGHAGDTTFATVNELIFNNSGTHDVIVSPGATNPFPGPLGGTAPTFTVPAGSTKRWHSPAGWAVSGTVKTIKFDPSTNAATLHVAVGGA